VIRMAKVADAAQIAAIYAPFCSDAVVSFEETPPSTDAMAQRIASTIERLPWIVYEDASEILGYAYAGRFRERAAYRWSVEVSCYVREDRLRRGIGHALYSTLFDLLVALGYYNACAGVTLPNPASVAFHEAFGFEPVGVYRHVGFKFGAWHDVGWWQKQLSPLATNPKSPRYLTELEDAAILTTR
jgi:L-amino acid N-acyltransferase YncA